MAPGARAPPGVTRREPHGPEGFRWLRVVRLDYRDAVGKARQWESVERRTRAPGGVDAVAVLARIEGLPEASPGGAAARGAPAEPRTVLVSQFRPPVDAEVLELPAGLIDAGETPEAAAVRELWEETGWRGRAAGTSPVVFSTPGLSSENMVLVVVDVDAGAPENRTVEAHPDEGEHIRTHLVGLGDLQAEIEGLCRGPASDGGGALAVDARLWSLAAGQRLLPRKDGLEALESKLDSQFPRGRPKPKLNFGPRAVVGAFVVGALAAPLLAPRRR